MGVNPDSGNPSAPSVGKAVIEGERARGLAGSGLTGAAAQTHSGWDAGRPPRKPVIQEETGFPLPVLVLARLSVLF